MTTKEEVLEEMILCLKEYQQNIHPDNPEERQPINPKYYELEKVANDDYDLYFTYHILPQVVLDAIDKILNPPEPEPIPNPLPRPTLPL